MSDTRPYGPQGVWILMTVLSAIAFAAAPVLVRWLSAAEMQPVSIAFARFSLTAAIMLPFLGLRGGHLGATLMGLLAGAGMGYGWVGYAITLEHVTMATAGALYMSYPVFAVLFMMAFTKQPPGVRPTLAALLSATAIWLVLPPAKIAELPMEVLLFALAAPASLGFAVTVRVAWLMELSPVQVLACVPLGACIGLAPALFLQPEAQILPTAAQWPWVIALAAGAVLLPSFLHAVSAPRLGALRTTTVGAFEIPAIYAFGGWFFAESPTEREVAAGIVAVAAMMLVAVSHRPRGRPPSA